MTVGSNVTASSPASSRPSRARRRHANNWLADKPWHRAVVDTCRRPSWLSATIRRFSTSVQRRRRPTWITSSRDTLRIVVWSVIRLCLHSPTSATRRPSPEGYAEGRSCTPGAALAGLLLAANNGQPKLRPAPKEGTGGLIRPARCLVLRRVLPLLEARRGSLPEAGLHPRSSQTQSPPTKFASRREAPAGS